MRSFLSLVTVAVLVGSVVAQEMPKPGKEHEFLKKMEGKWESVMKMQGQEAKGVTTYKSDLGGFWVASTMESELGGVKWTGKGLDGYCPIKKKYLTIWTDSMGPSPVIMAGDYDADKKTMTQEGEGPGMDGKMTKYKSVTTMPDADNMTMTMYVGDGKEPMFTITYKRVKK